MTIGRIDAVEPIQNKNIGKPSPAAKNLQGDSVHISAEAKEKAEWFETIEIVSSVPDVRSDLVAELKAKINDPSYLNEKIVSGTAERLLDVLMP